ncbi:MAG TPA: AAA family ATPase [Myxococcota bacterium]|jgi:DNA-binding winged helix-turn-helix (wHTH) protein
MDAPARRATIGRVLFRFDDYELDEDAGELRRAGARIEIQPKPFELLRLLVRERARVVSSEALMRALWPDVAVTPSSLTRAVSHARRAIGDTHKGERIQSAARRGYRFVAEVREGAAPIAAAPERAEHAWSTPFVGREEALAELRAAFAAASAGAASIALVTGRAGIGKTRLVEAFARECERAGARVLEARCRDREGAPAFWMWGQLLRRLGEHDPSAPALQELRRRSEELGLLATPSAARPATHSPEQSRFLFFEAAAELIRHATRGAPLVIVLEDVQWAANESLRMLEHVAYELAQARLLVIATVRDEGATRARPVDRTLAALHQLERCRAIELRAFSRREVGELLALAIGQPAPADLISELAARTEGVPLFLREALRALEASGDLAHPERLAARALPIAEKSLQLLRRGLDALPERCIALLEAGAVLGREFALTLAADVGGLSRDDAAEALDAAVAAGVVEPARSAGAASWRFAHALHREAVYEGVAPGRRARLHLRAAERIEQRAAPELSGVASELSYHHFEALAVGEPERALHFATSAAEQSSARLAWDEAASHFARGVAAAEQLIPSDPPRKLELLLRLGEAHALARDPEGRRSALRDAAALATSLGRCGEMVRAAVAHVDLSEWVPSDPDAERLLHAALARAPVDDARARAQLLTRLAYRRIRTDGRAAAEIAREALPLARGTRDPDLIQEAAYVLLFALAGPDALAERAALRGEIEAAARATPRRDTGLIALLDLASDRLMLGDAEGARELRRSAGALAGESPHPGLRWHLATYDAGLAALEGRLDDAEREAQEALGAGQRARHPYARGCYDIQRVTVAQERGDPGPALAVFAPFVAREHAGWSVPIHWLLALVARARIAAGERESARQIWSQLAEPGFAAVPRNIRWTRSLVEIAHLCADLDDRARAPELIALLEPVADQHGVIPIPIAYGGPVRHALARLQDLAGERARAEASYAGALADCERVGARGWRARVLLDAARSQRDAKRARAAREEARAIAERLGQSALAQQAARELSAEAPRGARARR